jgi:hypothetical protein
MKQYTARLRKLEDARAGPAEEEDRFVDSLLYGDLLEEQPDLALVTRADTDLETFLRIADGVARCRQDYRRVRELRAMQPPEPDDPELDAGWTPSGLNTVLAERIEREGREGKREKDMQKEHDAMARARKRLGLPPVDYAAAARKR